MDTQFLAISLENILAGEPLPAAIYVFISQRYITFRAAGDIINRATYERLELKRVECLFIAAKDAALYEAWKSKVAGPVPPPLPAEAKDYPKYREEVQRAALDIFHAAHPELAIQKAMGSSRQLVNEMMKFPYSVKSLTQLQTHSRSIVHHSVNVSVLSVYLAIQLGYSHNVILQNIALGALLHDVGKARIRITDEDTTETIEAKMKEHSSIGVRFLEPMEKEIPNEVMMIVAQHHEAHDGSGYPKKLRGTSIYDLARIVAIANVFDNLVGESSGALIDRQRKAILQMEQVLSNKYDPDKLQKSMKVLRMGV